MTGNLTPKYPPAVRPFLHFFHTVKFRGPGRTAERATPLFQPPPPFPWLSLLLKVMQNFFCFSTEQSLLPVWHIEATSASDEIVEDICLPPSAEVKEEEVPAEAGGLYWVSNRPVFDSLIRCAQLGDAGVAVRHRSAHSLELDIYDPLLFYQRHQACLKKSHAVNIASRIKAFRRYFVPLDKNARWTFNAQISIKLKTNQMAYNAYRDAIRRHPFRQ